MLLILGTLLALPPAAQEPVDWLDQFPDVTTVAQVALEEYQAELGTVRPEYTWSAANVAGTFRTLREIIELRQRREWFMSGARKQKLRQLIAAYQEAELTVGRGWLARVRPDPVRPPGVFCPEEECYLLGLEVAINARSSSASYRKRVLDRLFPCGDQAKELYQLRQSTYSQPKGAFPWFWKLGYLESPAHTLRIEGDFAGVAPAGCDVYGGDADRDGLCDSWKPAPRPGAVEESPAKDGRCIELIRVLVAEPGGLKVGIRAGTVAPGSIVNFRVAQATSADAASAQVIWQGTARVCARGTTSAECPGIKPPPWPAPAGSTDPREPENWPLYVVMAAGAPIALSQAAGSDALRFLQVSATSPASEKPVSCERPSPAWPSGESALLASGLHGPYARSEDAVWLEPGWTTIQVTGRTRFPKSEHGFLVVRKGAGGMYYATPPLRSSQAAWHWILTGLKPLFYYADYHASFRQAFEHSCEDKNAFVVDATVHSHIPTFSKYQDNFSLLDFEGSFPILADGDTPQLTAWSGEPGNWLMTALKRMYMLDSDHGCMRFFELTKGFVPPDMTLDDDARLLAWQKTVTSKCVTP